MKNKKKILLSLISILLLSIICSSFVFADETKNLTIATNPNTETLSDDLVLTETNVTLTTPVNGNVFIFADNVIINTKIQGNLFIFAKNIDISSKSYVNSSTFICGETVNISGDLYDLYSCSKSLTLTEYSRVLRSVKAIGESLNFYGQILNNANLMFKNIETSSNAKITGNLVYSSESNFPKENVLGSYTFNEFPKPTVENRQINLLHDLLSEITICGIIILILALACPKFVEKEARISKENSLIAIASGAISLIAIPFICFILMITLIGILPGISLLLMYIFTLIALVNSIVALTLAKLVATKFNKKKVFTIFMSLIFLVAIFFVCRIPILGNIISLFIAIYGLGLLINSFFKFKNTNKSEKKIIEETK